MRGHLVSQGQQRDIAVQTPWGGSGMGRSLAWGGEKFKSIEIKCCF